MCQFNVQLSTSPEAIYQNLKKRVEQANGTMDGNAAAGNFSVPLPLGNYISGGYTISDSNVEITITHHPILISCETIEKYVQQHLPQVLV